MPTSGHGRYRKEKSTRLIGGFTLLEILLVVMIIGIGASLIVPGLSATRVSAKDEAERIASLIDHAQTVAGLRGVPLAWQADAVGYGFLDWRGAWAPMTKDRALRRRDLPPGITLSLSSPLPGAKAASMGTSAGSAADSPSPRDAPSAPAQPLLVFPPSGFTRPFSLTVTSAEGAWDVVGDAAGRLSLVNAPRR